MAANAVEGLYEVGYVVQQAPVPFGFYLAFAGEPVMAAAGEIVSNLDLPVGAIIRSASVSIEARPAGHASIGDVARVRTATGDDDSASTQLVVDFGGLRTVSGLSAPAAITSIKPWFGTKFDSGNLTTSSLPVATGASVTFIEVATERLLVTLGASVTPATLAASGAVTVSTSPADIEIVVAGERAHFAPGSVKGTGVLESTVDITDAVRAAVSSGVHPVPVTLRSSVPSQLSLAPVVDYLESHAVTFSEGEVRSIDATSEGAIDLVVPLGAGAADWDVRLVTVDFTIDPGPERVVPPTGPDTEPDAELVCDPDHPLVVRLPPSLLRRFESISGVRVLAGVETAAEVAGSFRIGTFDPAGNPVPGDELPGPALIPTPLDIGPVAWHTLAADKPIAAGADVDLWVVVQATRGTIRLPLAEDVPGGSDSVDDVALVRRRAPNGLFRSLPTVAGVSTRAVPLRVRGVAPAAALIDAVVFSIPGTESAVVSSLVETERGARVEFIADAGFEPAISGATGDDLVLRLVLHAAASVSIGPIVVGYKEGS